jgi:hypothetical protein
MWPIQLAFRFLISCRNIIFSDFDNAVLNVRWT